MPSDNVQHDLQYGSLINIIIYLAIRQCAAWSSKLISHDFPERRKPRKQKETHAPSLPPCRANFRLVYSNCCPCSFLLVTFYSGFIRTIMIPGMGYCCLKSEMSGQISLETLWNKIALTVDFWGCPPIIGVVWTIIDFWCFEVIGIVQANELGDCLLIEIVPANGFTGCLLTAIAWTIDFVWLTWIELVGATALRDRPWIGIARTIGFESDPLKNRNWNYCHDYRVQEVSVIRKAGSYLYNYIQQQLVWHSYSTQE